MHSNEETKIWLITGVSSGLGEALAEAVVNSGDFVIGTLRSQPQIDAFNEKYAGRGMALRLDLTRQTDIARVADEVRERFGRIDVLVNNAGYGFAGAIEEATETEIRQVFETNFFGPLLLTQSLLPLFRRQGQGHLIQLSSHGGFKAFAGFGVYNASKFALEGASEALAAELAPLGIKVTLVEPGPFRTSFAGTAFQLAARRIPDYENTAGSFRSRMKQVDGQQEGDPAKAAAAILRIARLDNPPLRLPLGRIAVQTITAKLQSVQQDLDLWREVAEDAVLK